MLQQLPENKQTNKITSNKKTNKKQAHIEREKNLFGIVLVTRSDLI